MKNAVIIGRSDFIHKVDMDALLNLDVVTIGINQQDFVTDYIAYLDKRHSILAGVKELTMPINQKYQFTHDFVLEWLKDKADNVYLCGCADFASKEHYNSNVPFMPTDKSVKISKNFIENKASKWYNLSTLNQDSLLDIKKTSSILGVKVVK